MLAIVVFWQQATSNDKTDPIKNSKTQHQIPGPSRMLCAPNRQRHRKALYAPAGFRDAETHTEISLVLRADPITFRAQAASAARFTLRKQLAARFVAWREITEGTRNPSSAF
jgi:hypothetical protein